MKEVDWMELDGEVGLTSEVSGKCRYAPCSRGWRLEVGAVPRTFANVMPCGENEENASTYVIPWEFGVVGYGCGQISVDKVGSH